MASLERPLVSFTLLGCNQENYIREAIEGALSQTYSPLEIILSDDCSNDRTFEVMKEMTKAYNGPHKIVLNRNQKNLGCGNHVSLVMDMAQGELIVRADGDDISLPERTMALTEAWLKAGRPAGVGSEVITINELGETIGLKCKTFSTSGYKPGVIPAPELIRLFLQERPLGLVGCCAAWSKANWKLFGRFADGVQQEDTVSSFRGFLHGGLNSISQELVKYRAHELNASFSICHKQSTRSSLSIHKSQALSVAKAAKRRHAEFMTIRNDIATAKKKLGLDPKSVKDLENVIDRRIDTLAIRKEWWNHGFFRRLQYWNHSPYSPWHQRISSLFGLNGFVLIRYIVVQIKTLRSK